MNRRLPALFSVRDSRRRGVALVITLSLLVLVTFAAVAFFSRATANRRIEATRTNQLLASSLARSAEAYILSQFFQEIENNSDKLGTAPQIIYKPKTAAAMVPEPKGTSAINNFDEFPSLVRQSVPGADPNASGDNTAQPAANGVVVKPEVWNAPRLHTGSGFTSGQTPNWIYIQRDGTLSNSATPNTVGRFAYNVYEVGGLLDANVAGHPGLTGNSLQEIKFSTAGADLTALGVGQSAITNLVQYRTNNFSGSYLELVRNATLSGFLSSSVMVGGSNVVFNRFSTRQDLIRYVKQKNSGLEPALPYLTHFSRHSTSPSWHPTTPPGSTINYAGQANNNASPNRFLPNVRVQTGFTRADGTQAKPGEPLLKHRFPLSRLAALGPNGVNPAGKTLVNGQLTSATPATVQRDFGLRWSNGRWDYVGHSGISVQDKIKTLAEVAAEGREPNFFELLKAAILSGSLGKAADNKTLAGNPTRTLEGDQDLQIIRIGANIIDQFDNNNFPTTINFGGVHQHGVEDLPYLFGILNQERWRRDPWTTTPSGGPPGSTATNYTISVGWIWTPTFWNPHRSVIPPSGQPIQFRSRILGGLIERVQHTGAGNSFGNVASLNQNTPISIPTQEIVFSGAAANNFRDRNRAATSGFASGDIYSRINWWNPNSGKGGNYCGFVVLTKNQTTITGITTNGTNPPGWFARVDVNQVQIGLEYNDGTSWKIYDTLTGYTNLPITGITTGPIDNWEYGTCAFWTLAQNDISDDPQFSGKWDPRTTRWAACRGTSRTVNNPPNNSIIFTLWNVTSGRADSYRYNKPFNPPILSVNFEPTYFTRWPNGGLITQMDVKFADPDGVVRPNDGYLGPNLLQNPSIQEFKFPILQRRFLSVAELGYTFRDTPWQSLNFFHERSADGGLLDVFCVEEESNLSCGKINLNRAPKKVIEAVSRGVPRDPEGTGVVPDFSYNFDQFLNDSKLTDKAKIVNFVSSNRNPDSEGLKWRREAPVRALADVSEFRTWNFFVDLIVQNGRVAAGSSNFLPEGQERRWTSLAIDRLTAKILDLQSEIYKTQN